MADFQKVYSIRFETKQPMVALASLEKKLIKIAAITKGIGVQFERSVGAKAAASMERLGKSVDNARRSSVKFGKSIDRNNNRLARQRIHLTQVRGGLDTVARKLAIASAAFVGFGAVAVKNSLELNKAMANVSTLLTGGTEQINGLKRSVQGLATETGKSTDDLAEGLYEVVSALGEGADNMNQLDVATRAAVAGRSTTIGAVKLLAAVTKGYGDTSSKAQAKVSDLAFQTVKLGQTTFPELAASMGKVVPLAAAMNTSQEELFGTMATLTGVTGDTAEVSTQLASVYSSFLKPSAAMNNAVAKINKAHKEYNFESGAAMLKALGFRKSLLLVNEAADGNESKLAKILKRKEALVGALALLGGQSDVYKDKLEKMNSVVGATDDAYRKQTEGINKQGHSWDRTKQRMVVFSQRLGDKLLPVLERLLTKLEPVLKYIENMDDEAIDSAIAIGKWAVQLAIAAKGLSLFLGTVQGLGTLKNLTTGLSNVSTGMVGVNTKAQGVGRTIGTWAGGILAAAAAGYTLGTMLDDIFFAPDRKRKGKEEDALENAIRTGKDVARTGTVEQQEAALENLSNRTEGTTYFKPAPMDVAASWFSGSESPRAAFDRRNKSGKEASAALEQSILAGRFENWLGQGKGAYGVSAPAAAPTQSSNTTTNVGPTTINVSGAGDPEKVAQAVERRLTKSMQRGSQGIAAGEQ